MLRALASVRQTQVAEILGVSEATVSRFKDGELARAAKILAALNLKCVPLEMRCFKRDEIEALLFLAKRRLEETKTTDELEWEQDL